jgi:hypothetical protein
MAEANSEITGKFAAEVTHWLVGGTIESVMADGEAVKAIVVRKNGKLCTLTPMGQMVVRFA